jgi:hypothetical protein
MSFISLTLFGALLALKPKKTNKRQANPSIEPTSCAHPHWSPDSAYGSYKDEHGVTRKTARVIESRCLTCGTVQKGSGQ